MAARKTVQQARPQAPQMEPVSAEEMAYRAEARLHGWKRLASLLKNGGYDMADDVNKIAHAMKEAGLI